MRAFIFALLFFTATLSLGPAFGSGAGIVEVDRGQGTIGSGN